MTGKSKGKLVSHLKDQDNSVCLGERPRWRQNSPETGTEYHFGTAAWTRPNRSSTRWKLRQVDVGKSVLRFRDTWCRAGRTTRPTARCTPVTGGFQDYGLRRTFVYMDTRSNGNDCRVRRRRILNIEFLPWLKRNLPANRKCIPKPGLWGGGRGGACALPPPSGTL